MPYFASTMFKCSFIVEGYIAAKANLCTDLERTGVHRIPLECVQHLGVAQTGFFGSDRGGGIIRVICGEADF
jgi:hypothetical protein